MKISIQNACDETRARNRERKNSSTAKKERKDITSAKEKRKNITIREEITKEAREKRKSTDVPFT